MIALMSPQGFANIMGKMWPELIDAMPFGHGRHDALYGQGSRGVVAYETAVPGIVPQAFADDDAEGDACYA